jgi:hypothetical protein
MPKLFPSVNQMLQVSIKGRLQNLSALPRKSVSVNKRCKGTEIMLERMAFDENQEPNKSIRSRHNMTEGLPGYQPLLRLCGMLQQPLGFELTI